MGPEAFYGEILAEVYLLPEKPKFFVEAATWTLTVQGVNTQFECSFFQFKRPFLKNLSMNKLRHQCRQKRNLLSALTQKKHEQQATRLFLRAPWAQRPSKVALFLSIDSELGTQQLIQALWHRRFKIYLPVLKTFRGRDMAFAPYHPKSQLKLNSFGILEPQTPHAQHLTGAQLDLVIMPLTCFDAQGHRIGMGGGFYDRTFAFKRHQPKRPPKLIGWAHSCQLQDQIQTKPWDIPLDALVTENKVIAHFIRD